MINITSRVPLLPVGQPINYDSGPPIWLFICRFLIIPIPLVTLRPELGIGK